MLLVISFIFLKTCYFTNNFYIFIKFFSSHFQIPGFLFLVHYLFFKVSKAYLIAFACIFFHRLHYHYYLFSLIVHFKFKIFFLLTFYYHLEVWSSKLHVSSLKLYFTSIISKSTNYNLIYMIFN